jgi:hypothetical protein
METNESPQLDALLLGEIQVLLSEKRTALSSMRTGIAVFALPLSVLSVLIATSRYYSIGKVMPLLMPLLLLNLGLVVLGTWLVFHSIGRLHHYDLHLRADPEISVARGGCRLTQTNLAAFSAVGTSRVRELGNKGTLASGNACPTGLLSIPRRAAEDDTRSSETQASAALARVRFFQSTPKTFISALSTSNRAATPLYFLMTPVAVLVTAP